MLAVPGLAAAVHGQTGTEERQSAATQPPEDEQVQEGMLPVPDYSGDWSTRRFLSGDWGGTRADWANDGVTFDLEWYQVAQGNVSGGLDNSWKYVTNLDLYSKLDLMRMGVLPGALVSFRAQSRFGETVNGDTGVLLPVNTYSYFPLTDPLDENVPIAITELNYLQFFTDELGLLLGKITTMANANEFAGGEGRTQFMNFQFIYPSVFANVTPYSTLAAGGLWQPSSDVTVTSILMNSQDSSTTTGFDDIGEGTSWWTSVDTQHTLGDLPGGSTFGGVYAFNGDFARIGGINISPGGVSIDTESEAWAAYWSGWQYLYTEQEPAGAVDPTDGRQGLEGMGMFAMLGLSDPDTNPVAWSANVGLSARGLIPGRDADVAGLGYYYNSLQELRSFLPSNPLSSYTQGMEAYYNFAVATSVALTFDFQWNVSALQMIDDSIVLGFRLNLSF